MGLFFNKPADVAGSATPAILVGMFVAFGGVLFGYVRLFQILPCQQLTRTSYDTGTIGGILAMKYWRQLFSTGYINPEDDHPDVTASQTSEIVSILSAGTFFVSLLVWFVYNSVLTMCNQGRAVIGTNSRLHRTSVGHDLQYWSVHYRCDFTNRGNCDPNVRCR
jgi:hypothetical protein